MVYGRASKGKEATPSVVDIVDITALAHINALISDVKRGQKKEMDQFLSFLMTGGLQNQMAILMHLAKVFRTEAELPCGCTNYSCFLKLYCNL